MSKSIKTNVSYHTKMVYGLDDGEGIAVTVVKETGQIQLLMDPEGYGDAHELTLEDAKALRTILGKIIGWLENDENDDDQGCQS